MQGVVCVQGAVCAGGREVYYSKPCKKLAFLREHKPLFVRNYYF